MHTNPDPTQSPLDQACEILGGQTKLAEKLGISSPSISEWKKRGVPPERCEQIEQLTDGLVTCERLNEGYIWTRVDGRAYYRVRADKPADKPADRSADVARAA